jgi:hypothetical protein
VNAPGADRSETYPTRLAHAGAAVVDLRLALDAAIELRDQLIVEWCEAGATRRDVAHAVGLSEARVIAVLARS